jgi:hypothetical protein
MKSFIALTVGLTGTGAGASILDSAIAAPAALHSYIFSMPEPGSVDMLVAGVALMLFVAFRKKSKGY